MTDVLQEVCEAVGEYLHGPGARRDPALDKLLQAYERLSKDRTKPGTYRAGDGLRPSEHDRVEAALSLAVQAAGIELSETRWDDLCKTFTREFERLSRKADAHLKG